MSNLLFAIPYLAEAGLVVWDDQVNPRLEIIRPSAVKGTKFRGTVGDIVSCIGHASVLTNAPAATLTQERKDSWIVDISEGAAPGPGPTWFNESFTTLKEAVQAVQAVLDCYFSDRIDFKNDSLEQFFGNR